MMLNVSCVRLILAAWAWKTTIIVMVVMLRASAVVVNNVQDAIVSRVCETVWISITLMDDVHTRRDAIFVRSLSESNSKSCGAFTARTSCFSSPS